MTTQQPITAEVAARELYEANPFHRRADQYWTWEQLSPLVKSGWLKMGAVMAAEISRLRSQVDTLTDQLNEGLNSSEPTEDMITAGIDFALKSAVSSENPWPDYIAGLYRAMLAAAPSLPQDQSK